MAAGILTGYRMEGWGIIPNKVKRLFPTHPVVYWGFSPWE
jgi:hypothetical protein